MTNGNPLGAIGGLVGLGVTVIAAKAVVDTTQKLANKSTKKQKKYKEKDVVKRVLGKF
jgi:hypothetical protein